MSKAVIIYSSQNGTTKKIAERMKSALENRENEVEIFNTCQNKHIHLEEYDLIGIGCPTYMSRPTYEIMDYLNILKSFNNKNVFTFTTYGTEIGDGANWLRGKIKKMGGLDIGHFSCKGRNLFPGYTYRGYLFSPDSPKNEEMDEVELFIENVVSKVKSGIPFNPPEYDSKPHFIYRFERFVTNRFLIRHIYSHFFSSDRKRCINCDKCINSCPVNNIAKNDNERKVWGRNCILCMKCEISCPEKAVLSPISWFIFSPFLFCNIRKAIRKGIPYNRVNDMKGSRS